MAILLGAEFNSETERAKQLDAGVSEAHERIQLPERQTPRGLKAADGIAPWDFSVDWDGRSAGC